MDRLAYIAMTGAKQTEVAQAITANNLANVSTTGFRADLHAFSQRDVEGTGLPTRTNAVVDAYGIDLREGAIQTTGHNLDVAISGEGYFAVQTPNGGEAYTRAGNFRVGSGGLLTTADGMPVIGEGGPVAVPPNETLLIGNDGTITVRSLGQGPEALSIVDRLKLVKPDPESLVKGPDGLLRTADGAIAPADATVSVQSGALESSNVNVADALVSMISLARQYESQVNIIRNAEDNADAAAAMLRSSGG
ncbi:MAG: flagellar basal-body rod protein FlgF [Pseudomonadota bacterium]